MVLLLFWKAHKLKPWMVNEMSKGIVIGAAILGFIAPITVAISSGVHFGDESAGWFVAASWVCSVISGLFAVMLDSMGIPSE